MTDVILPIILAFLALLGTGGVWGYLQSRKEAPVKKVTADLAVAHTSQQMALAMAMAARDDNVGLRKDLNADRSALQVLSGRVDELSRQVREQNRTIGRLQDLVARFSDGWDHLIRNWATVRQLDTPPAKPAIPPQHLTF